MDWITDNIIGGINKWFADLVTGIVNAAFKLICDTIIDLTDVNKYINTSKYLVYVQVLAGSLLILAVTWEAFKQLSGGAFSTSEKSVSTIALKTVFAGLFIYIMPWSVINVFLPINNALIELIQSIGTKVDKTSFSVSSTITSNFASNGAFVILMGLVLGIAFLVLAIAGGIRYVELIICILFAPIAAVSIVNEGEGAKVWVRETTCVVFTQAVQILLLQLLINIMEATTGVMMIVLSVGAITVMLKGPQVLRNYLYSSGVGSTGVGAAGAAGRMAAMKLIMSSAVPTE